MAWKKILLVKIFVFNKKIVMLCIPSLFLTCHSPTISRTLANQKKKLGKQKYQLKFKNTLSRNNFEQWNKNQFFMLMGYPTKQTENTWKKRKLWFKHFFIYVKIKVRTYLDAQFSVQDLVWKHLIPKRLFWAHFN